MKKTFCLLNVVILASSTFLASIAYSSGTYISPPPRPKPALDCEKPVNKDQPVCKGMK